MRKVSFGVLAVSAAAAIAVSLALSRAAEPVAPSHAQKKEHAKMETASFGAGCFWGVEAAFRQVKGVTATTVGYCGGAKLNPTYKNVCTNTTGHAETVLVEFDPTQVTYDQLLDVFWKCHDPTQRNRQGPDFGTQYRSVIFYHTPEQKAAALASKHKLQHGGQHKKPIATEIVPAAAFYRAEDYHQQYLEKRGEASCHLPPAGQ